MCRWLSYSGETVFLEHFLFKPENSLIEQSMHARKGATSTNGDGFGIGWYGEQETPGLYRDTLPAWNDCNLRSLSHQIQSSLFLAHVRASTGSATTRYNCHPFSYENWLFMHNGQIGEFDKVHRRLDILIPDELYPHKLGNTDSEIIFLLLIKNGLQQNVAEAIRLTIAEVEKAMQESGVTEAFRFSACLSDGKAIYIPRYSSDEKPPTIFWCENKGQLLAASEPLVIKDAHWCKVPPDNMLIFEQGEHRLEPLF